VLKAVAIGSAAALVTLGIAGVLASGGVLSLPSRVQADRLIFGLQSPFVRNYGLNVPYDAVALLIPLSVPFLLLCVFRGPRRLIAGTALALISFFVLLVFQARGMLLQLAVALAVAAWLLMKSFRAVLLLLGGFAVLQLGIVLFSSDQLSSGIRIGTDAAAVQQVMGSPETLLFGTNEDIVFQIGANNAGYGAAISTDPGANAIHNLFLQNLVEGGLLPFLLITSAYGMLLFHAFRGYLRERGSFASMVLLLAAVLVILEVNLEPVRANIVGSWLVLGLVLGRSSVRPPPTSEYEFAWPPPSGSGLPLTTRSVR
jgi:O-antigen ligase